MPRKNLSSVIEIAGADHASIYNSIPTPVCIVSLEKEVKFTNTACEKLLGNTIKKGDMCHDETREHCMDCLVNVVREGNEVPEEVCKIQRVIKGRVFQISQEVIAFEGELAILEQYTDITDLVEAQREIDCLIKGIKEGVVIFRDGTVEGFNPQIYEMFGYSVGEVDAFKTVDDLDECFMDGENQVLIRDVLLEVAREKSMKKVYMAKHKDGHYFPVEVTVSYIKTESKKRLALAMVRDISEEREREEKLKALTMTDALTEIANRRKFDEVIQIEWKRALRNKTEISVLIIDIDFFKNFNDSYGHQNGDDILKKVALTLQNNLNRAGDLVARIGGEEFAVILPGGRGQAENLASILNTAIQDLKIQHNQSDVSDYVSISIGVATVVPNEQENYKQLTVAADKALYVAKKQRNTFSTYDQDCLPVAPEDSDLGIEIVEIESDQAAE